MGSQSHATSIRSHRAWALMALAAGIVLAGSAASQAQSALPAGTPGRFTMQPTDGGVLRMDTQTGVLSMCRQLSGNWSCTMLPDDRAAAADEIERLKAENIELKSAVKRLEELAGVPAGTDGGGVRRRSGLPLPTEEELDKALNTMERMLKKFKDKIKELDEPSGRRGTAL